MPLLFLANSASKMVQIVAGHADFESLVILTNTRTDNAHTTYHICVVNQ